MKKCIAIVLAIVLFVSVLPFPTYAQQADPDGINASNYLSGYGAYLYSNGTHGKLKLAFEVYATGYMSIVGIQRIVVRKANGSLYQTIYGSTGNGLQAANAAQKIGEYTLNLTAGSSYYCTVTFIAKNSSGSDTRTVTTSVVTCP